MKKYFLYELKKSGFTIACLSVICSIIYLIAIMEIPPETLGKYGNIPLEVVTVLGIVLAFCIPFIQLSYKMKKRSADLFFALPLSHTKILTVKYLTGLVIVLASYGTAYILGTFVVIIRATQNFIYPEFYVVHFFASLIPLYIIYAVCSFAFTRAGRVSDGALNAVCWACVLFTIAFVLNTLTAPKSFYAPEYSTRYNIFYDYFSMISPAETCSEYFAYLITGTTYHYGLYGPISVASMAVAYSLMGLMGIGATVGLFLCERKARFEDIEQISTSPFGIPLMLPVYTVCISALCMYGTTERSLFIVFAIAMYLVSAYYKRTLKIGKWQTIILVSSLAVGFIIGVIAYYV